MTDPTPHRATPEQWHRVLFMESLQSDAAAVDLASTVCELRARVEALEAQQQAQQPAAPEPDDSPNELVKQVANVFVDEEPNHESDSYFQSKARSQIRVVARWLRANGFDAAANRLEREAGR